MSAYVDQVVTRDTFQLQEAQRDPVRLRRYVDAFAMNTAHGRQEVDLALELGGGRVIGIEIKSGSSPNPKAAKHLMWLRDQLGDRFVAGVVFHTGPHGYPLGERVVAAPVSALWT